MTVSFEVVSVGSTMTARVVMQGGRFTREVARLSLSQADWEDFTRCLSRLPRAEPGRLVFAPVPKMAPPPGRGNGFLAPPLRAEAVA
jgi:hypothetical protein